MERIKYLAYHHFTDGKAPREGVQAASTKVEYIISVLNRCGIKVDLISKTGVSSDNFNLDFGSVIERENGNTIRHFISLGCLKSPLRVISRYLNNLHFILWFVFHVKRNEQVIVYHSLGYSRMLCLLKRITGCRYIGEIEEIYQHVKNKSVSEQKYEYKFIGLCDKYIFPTNLLNEYINKSNKPYCIVHGVYKIEKSRNVSFNDGRIHVVYGGTFDPNKGGAAAAAAAAYLPENYHIHICGFGSSNEVLTMKELIKETQANSKATITYDGLLVGEEYIKHIQKCQIGLSTQNPEAAFNATSFPSKILVYLSNGLRVVTIRIPAIETSSVSNCLYFYDRQTPEEIAKAILHVSLNEPFTTQELLKEINDQFEVDLNHLVNC